MNTNHNHTLAVASHPGQLMAQIGPETRQVITLGEEKGWSFNLLGRARLPEQPVQLDQWIIVPASQDSSEIPVRTYRRIQALFANGIRPQGFVVVHEAPRLLSAPPVVKPPAYREPFPPEIEKPKGAAIATGLVASLLSSALLGTSLTIFGALFLGLAMLDPVVVAVMEDGCWVEIDRWATKV